MAGTFTPGRGAEGFELDWDSIDVLATAAEAARRAANRVAEAGKELARVSHETNPDPWFNRTYQTEESLYVKPAVIEIGTHGPHVWAEWGVRDVPRFWADGKDHESPPPSTKDVALWLEFGTASMRSAHPWLYPAWDASKVTMMAELKAAYKEVEASGAPSAIRSELGRFLPHSLLD